MSGCIRRTTAGRYAKYSPRAGNKRMRRKRRPIDHHQQPTSVERSPRDDPLT